MLSTMEQRTDGIHIIIDALQLTNPAEGMIGFSSLLFWRNVLLGIDDKNDVSLEGDQIIVLDEVGIRFSPHRHHQTPHVILSRKSKLDIDVFSLDSERM